MYWSSSINGLQVPVGSMWLTWLQATGGEFSISGLETRNELLVMQEELH